MNDLRYWWVNHSQTSKDEIGHGYLWSPKREANGARSQFYQNMKETCPGDRVVSFANGKIAHVGIVREHAFTSQIPFLGDSLVGDWSGDGWLVPTRWKLVPSPIRPIEFAKDLAPLLPRKYSPIRENGHGNQKAYLAEISSELFEKLSLLGRFPAQRTIALGTRTIKARVVEETEKSIEKQIFSDVDLSSTEKKRLILARKGQGHFRNNIEK